MQILRNGLFEYLIIGHKNKWQNIPSCTFELVAQAVTFSTRKAKNCQRCRLVPFSISNGILKSCIVREVTKQYQLSIGVSHVSIHYDSFLRISSSYQCKKIFIQHINLLCVLGDELLRVWLGRLVDIPSVIHGN